MRAVIRTPGGALLHVSTDGWTLDLPGPGEAESAYDETLRALNKRYPVQATPSTDFIDKAKQAVAEYWPSEAAQLMGLEPEPGPDPRLPY